jgi:hypothetical protein
MWKFDYEFGLTPLLGCSWLSVKRGYLRVNPVSGFLLPVVVSNENENENGKRSVSNSSCLRG